MTRGAGPFRAGFAGKRAYVVGGSQGIGLAAALQLAEAGAHVQVFARRPEPLGRAVNALGARRRGGGQHIGGRALDAGDAAAVEGVMKDAVASFGVPDLLVNAAGRAIPRRFEEVDAAQLEDTLRQNLVTCWNTCAALVPHMKGRGGAIVNTSSLAGWMGVFGYTDYCAAKFAVVGFSDALRQELRPHGVSVHVLCPPDTDTPGLAEEDRTKPEETRAISASARVLSAEAVAGAMLRGVQRGEPVIVPGREARVAYWLRRIAPGLLERYAARVVDRVRARS